ncbi:MAG: hypothetical protein ACKOXK_01810 [Chakrabartia sp.]
MSPDTPCCDPSAAAAAALPMRQGPQMLVRELQASLELADALGLDLVALRIAEALDALCDHVARQDGQAPSRHGH